MTGFGRLTHYARVLEEHPHPLRLLASRALRATGLSRLVVMRFPRFRLRLYPTSLSESYWVDRADRDFDHRFLERYLRPGDVVVDVGANIGALSVHAAALVGDEGRVIAIEAHPRTYGFLLGNLALNAARNVSPRQVALGASTGEVAFSDRRNDDVNAVDSAGAVRVPMTTLDAALSSGDAPGIALLKVDVEGYEREVFRGARETLRRVSCVYFESWDQSAAAYGHDTSGVVALLTEAGFATYRFEGDAIVAVEPGYRSSDCENLVAVRDAGAFRARWGS